MSSGPAYVFDVVFCTRMAALQSTFAQAVTVSAQPFGGEVVLRPPEEFSAFIDARHASECHVVVSFPCKTAAESWTKSPACQALAPPLPGDRVRLEIGPILPTFSKQGDGSRAALSPCAPCMSQLSPSATEDREYVHVGLRFAAPSRVDTVFSTTGGTDQARQLHLVEFPTMAEALAWRSSPAYQAVVPPQIAATTSNLVIHPGRVPAFSFSDKLN
jgi:uncharacterized protein (DUF1330 family)